MSDPHLSYIVLAYAIAIVAVVAVAARIILDYRRLRAELAGLEQNARTPRNGRDA